MPLKNKGGWQPTLENHRSKLGLRSTSLNATNRVDVAGKSSVHIKRLSVSVMLFTSIYIP